MSNATAEPTAVAEPRNTDDEINRLRALRQEVESNLAGGPATADESNRLRVELEDLEDSIDILEARAENAGKPTYTLEQARAELAARRKAVGNL